jgi:outer membrane lipoprotein SlyB
MHRHVTNRPLALPRVTTDAARRPAQGAGLAFNGLWRAAVGLCRAPCREPTSKGSNVSQEAMTSPATPALPRNAVIAGVGLALAGVGLAAGLWLGSPRSAEQAPAAAQQALAGAGASKTGGGVIAKAQSADAATGGAARVTPLETQPAVASCTNCGVVEGVRAVQRKGEGTGVGAVAGGVIGGVIGNQMGSGNGKKAMTVIGAVGGGVAGHEIEKRARSETVYEVRVRMDDGSLRTLTRAQAPAPGARVRVDGQQLRVVSAADAPRTVRVSSGGA